MTVTGITAVRRLDFPTPAMAAGTPGMRCPRCETSTLHERARNGVFLSTPAPAATGSGWIVASSRS